MGDIVLLFSGWMHKIQACTYIHQLSSVLFFNPSVQHFNMSQRDVSKSLILCGISKVPFWNSTQNILPIHWKIWFLHNIEILRALRLKRSYAFLKRPPGPEGAAVLLPGYSVPIILEVWQYLGELHEMTSRRQYIPAYFILNTKRHIAQKTDTHDDVIKWKHFPHYWPFVKGTHWSLVDSPHKGQWRGALMFLWSAPEQTFEQTIEMPVIWDSITLITTSLQCKYCEMYKRWLYQTFNLV